MARVKLLPNKYGALQRRREGMERTDLRQKSRHRTRYALAMERDKHCCNMPSLRGANSITQESCSSLKGALEQ